MDGVSVISAKEPDNLWLICRKRLTPLSLCMYKYVYVYLCLYTYIYVTVYVTEKQMSLRKTNGHGKIMELERERTLQSRHISCIFLGRTCVYTYTSESIYLSHPGGKGSGGKGSGRPDRPRMNSIVSDAYTYTYGGSFGGGLN